MLERLGVAVAFLSMPTAVVAQAPDSSATTPDSTVVAESPGRAGPFFLIGGAYGQRQDLCALCSGVDDDDSFSGYLRVGRYLSHGIGIGLDASVWRLSRADVVLAEETVASATPRQTMLGNFSISATYRIWEVYLRAGGGVAYARMDVPDGLVTTDPEEESEGETAEGEQTGETSSTNPTVALRTATGLGIGYSVGAGIGLPMAGQISLTLFANWNVGRYDLVSSGFTMASDVRHRFFEVGLGIGFN